MDEARTAPVSVVVAVRDEQESLAALLRDLDLQTLVPAEVVLVDGGSVDGTRALAAAYADTRAGWLVVPAGPATPGRGRNLGVAASSQDWIAFTDAGIRVDPRWLERLWAAHLADPQAQVVYGTYEFDTHSFFEECAAIAYGSPRRPTPAGPARGPSVVSVLLTRQLFLSVGGFPDLRAGEDNIFLRAVAASGARAAWAPDAVVRWRLRPTLRATFERFRLYSFHNVVAGQQQHWHHRLARRYLPVAAGIGLAAATGSRRWLLLSVATVAGRVAGRMDKHSEGRGLAWRAHPRRLGTVAAVLLSNDAATVLGWWQGARARLPEPGVTRADHRATVRADDDKEDTPAQGSVERANPS